MTSGVYTRTEEHINNFIESKKMYFQTHSSWNKGLTKETDERVAKYCESRKGYKHSEETLKKMCLFQKKRIKEGTGSVIPFEKGHIPWNKGLTKKDERVRLNLEKAHKTMRKNNSYGNTKGMRIPKLSEAMKGDKNPMWNGGKTPYNKIYHDTADWRIWRKSVYERDNYVCQDCNIKGGKLHPHHIIPISVDPSPENVFDINNGQTLCVKCHRKKHKAMFLAFKNRKVFE